MIKEKKAHFLKKLILCVIAGFILVPLLVDAKPRYSRFAKIDRNYLVQQFIDEPGLDQKFLEKVFFHPKLKKIPVVTERNVYNVENKRNYDDFLSSYSVMVAHRFSKKWKTVLKRASSKFEVDEEVLVAILLVETGFGNLLGKYPVISVFSSILVDADSFIKIHQGKPDLDEDQKYRLARLEKKSRWAKHELSALLMIVKKTPYGPFDIKGSFAGAFGIPQFLPSSYLKWGFDSDKNGSVNLFLMPDSIYSTANYLKSHGWEKGLHLESNKKAIWSYNNSEYYVSTVMALANKIKELSGGENQGKEKKQTRIYDDDNPVL
ncbi:MAG: lytic murein transglycosylase [Deltaproteobacteria bacterium]|nr:lytic murein transglycosylase [Deltaproteobacteria bacterium]